MLDYKLTLDRQTNALNDSVFVKQTLMFQVTLDNIEMFTQCLTFQNGLKCITLSAQQSGLTYIILFIYLLQILPAFVLPISYTLQAFAKPAFSKCKPSNKRNEMVNSPSNKCTLSLEFKRSSSQPEWKTDRPTDWQIDKVGCSVTRTLPKISCGIL